MCSLCMGTFKLVLPSFTESSISFLKLKNQKRMIKQTIKSKHDLKIFNSDLVVLNTTNQLM